MAPTFLPQARPTYPGNADVSRNLSLLGDTLGRKVEQHKNKQALLEVGEAFQQGDLAGAQKAAFARGRPDLALKVTGAIESQKANEAAMAHRDRMYGLQQAQLELQRQKLNQPGGSSGYAKQPIYGRDEQGNPVIMQLSPSGEAVRTQMPPGVTPSVGTTKIDLGDRWGVLDQRSGALIGNIPKNLAGAEAQKVEGKAQGEAKVALPEVEAQSDDMLRTIEDTLNDPALNKSLGWNAWKQVVPGSPQKRVGSKIEQLQGQAFLQAFERLKGGGPITDVEGRKGTQAIARLQTTQDPEAFRAALEDLKQIVTSVKARARTKANASQNVIDYREFFKETQ